jgi:hypothetical protein
MVNIAVRPRTPATATATATTVDVRTDDRGLATGFTSVPCGRRAESCRVIALVAQTAELDANEPIGQCAQSLVMSGPVRPLAVV